MVDHCNEIVHFFGVPKTPCPDLEFDMFVLDAFDHVCKEKLHLILHGAELWYFGVGVFIKDVFDFAPFHLLAVLVEQCALLSVLESIGTDETRLTALWVDTDHETLVSVDTLRGVFEMFGSHLNIYVRLYSSIYELIL